MYSIFSALLTECIRWRHSLIIRGECMLLHRKSATPVGRPLGRERNQVGCLFDGIKQFGRVRTDAPNSPKTFSPWSSLRQHARLRGLAKSHVEL